MSSEIQIIAPRDINESQALAKTLSDSALMPDSLRKKPTDVFVVLMTGAELGLAPMQAIRSIHVIQGKGVLSADLMGGLVKKKRDICTYLKLVVSDEKICTYETLRVGDPSPTTLSFTIEQAKAAGLTSKDNWRKYPADMLRARCLSKICRAVYPDLCAGLYDEISAEDEDFKKEKEINPVKEHAENLKEKLKAALEKKPEPVDAEIVEPATSLEEGIRAAETIPDLEALIPVIKGLSEERRKELAPIYTQRKAELEAK